MGAGHGKCMEGAAAFEFQRGELLFVWIDLGAEGWGVVGKSDGTMGFLPGERVLVCVLNRKSLDLLLGTDCADGFDERSCHQREWEILADVPTLACELVRSVRRLCTGSERSSGI